MSRRNNTKSSTKRKSTTKAPTMTQKMEKDFQNAPVQLAAQFTKEATTLKQTESKLQASIAKLKTQVQKATSRTKIAAATKSLNTLNKQLNETSKMLQAAMNKQAKMTALRKVLSQFDKDWTKKSKTVKAKTPAKTSNKKPIAKSSKPAQIIPLQQPSVETVETSMDNVKVGGSTDITS